MGARSRSEVYRDRELRQASPRNFFSAEVSGRARMRQETGQPRAIEEKRRAIQDVLRRNQLTVLSKIDTIDT